MKVQQIRKRTAKFVDTWVGVEINTNYLKESLRLDDCYSSTVDGTRYVHIVKRCTKQQLSQLLELAQNISNNG